MKKNYPLYQKFPVYETFERMIDGLSERYGSRTAVSYRRHPHDPEAVNVSFRALSYDVHALADSAVRAGMSGAHVALVGGISYEWLLSYLALQIAGATVVPLDREWLAEDLSATARFADCRFLLCDADIADKGKLIAEENGIPLIPMRDQDGAGVAAMVREGDPYRKYTGPVDTRAPSAIVFTSGTTGKGKGVMLCQDGILSDIYQALKILEAGERTIVTLPPHHTYGSNIGMLALLYAGANLYLSSGIKHILREMKEFKPDFMILVPLYVETFHRKIVTALREKRMEGVVGAMRRVSNGLRRMSLDLRRQFFRGVLSAFGGELRLIACGGAPLREEQIKFFEDLGITLLNGYGITECSPLISCNRNEFVCRGSVGVPLPSLEVKIEEPDENGEGEICVKGPSVMLGYYKQPEETAAAIDEDRFFHTGDIGKLSEDGVLYITGRIKNLIILSNGKNIYPEEIEGALSAIEGVTEVVVYEGQSERGSEHNQVVAEIFPDRELLEGRGVTDLDAYFHGKIEAYNKSCVKYKQIGLVRLREEEFPKNTLRKILRFKLDTGIE